MKLSMWILYDWLIKQGLAPVAQIVEGQPLIERAKLFSPDEPGENDLEILTAEQAGLTDDDVVMLRFQQDQVLIPGHTLAQVHNQVINAIQYYNDWEKELLICLLEGKSLQDMLEVAHKVFQRPMFIKSDSSWVYAITKGYDADVHPDWARLQESVLSRQTDFNAVKTVSLDPQYQVVFTQKYPLIMYSPFYGGEVLHANVWLQERRICEIVTITNGRPFNAGEPHLMAFFAQMLHRVIQADTPLYLSHSGLAAFFAEMLETGTYDALNLNAVLHTLNWQENDEMVVLCVEIQAEHETPVLSVLREKLTEQFKYGCAFSFQGQLVCIANIRESGSFEKMIRAAAALIPPEIFTWGVSYEFSGLENFPAYYKQACLVLAKARANKQSYLTMHQVALTIIAEQLNSLPDLGTLVHPDIKRLMQADRLTNAQYTGTLLEFLLCGGNYTDAAHRLGLHRNSLIYRVNRIREIIHSNLDDAESKKIILLSYLFTGSG